MRASSASRTGPTGDIASASAGPTTRVRILTSGWKAQMRAPDHGGPNGRPGWVAGQATLSRRRRPSRWGVISDPDPAWSRRTRQAVTSS